MEKELGYERLAEDVILVDGKYYKAMEDDEIADLIWGEETSEPISIKDVKGEVLKDWHYIVGDSGIDISIVINECVDVPIEDMPALSLYLFKAERYLKNNI